MKTIIRLKNDATTGLIWLDDKPLEFNTQELLELSGGLAWNLGNFGANLVALAILLKFTDQRTALENYKDFKWELSELGPGFELEINISPWLSRKEVVQ